VALLLAVDNLQHVLPHLAGLLAGIDALPDTGGAVVVDDRGGLLVVGVQALLQGLGVVVAALDQRLASDVVLHVILGGVEGGVVGTAGGGVDQAASDASNEERVVDLELDGVLQRLVALLEHNVKTLGLGDGTGEAIQNETAQTTISKELRRTEGRQEEEVFATYPPWHSLLLLSSSLIMPIMMSSETRPPWSMIFLASRPRGVFFAT
jgi:hypothetical protein